MTTKRWSTGPDRSTVAKLRPIAKAGTFPTPEQTARDARRSYAFQVANEPSIEAVMMTWTTETYCAVCRVKGVFKTWEHAVYTTLCDGLYVYPTCGSKSCTKVVKSDAIHENPNIH